MHSSRPSSTFLGRRSAQLALTVSLAALLGACGGGGGGSTSAPASQTADASSNAPSTLASAQSGANGFQSVNNSFSTAGSGIPSCADPSDGVEFSTTSGFRFQAATQAQTLENLLNHVRCLAGVPALTRHASLDLAAENHAQYSIANGSATHTENSSLPAFTASNPGERMSMSGYTPLSAQRAEPYQWGEVLSRTGPLAKDAHDGLVSAIYHRLAMLSPQVVHAGVGLKTSADNKDMVAVIDMAASSAQRHGRLIAYPAAGQQQVPVSFNSDLELPDPFPSHGLVGYPVSVQSDRGSQLIVSRFELRDAGGSLVPSFLRSKTANPATGAEADSQLEANETFLAPVSALAADTLYTVQFDGTLDGTAVSKTWSFRTAAASALAVAESNNMTAGNFTRVKLNGCSGAYTWRFTNGLNVSMFSGSWLQVQATARGMQWLEVTDSCGAKQRIDIQAS